MKRFDEYNRNDFYYARTAREAFGGNFYIDKKQSTFKSFLRWLMFTGFLICLSIIL
jgi:hypothetical protein